jgi:hypothetical protein
MLRPGAVPSNDTRATHRATFDPVRATLLMGRKPDYLTGFRPVNIEAR